MVTVPVRLYPAIDASAHLRFHQLHRVCQSRLQHRKWCPSCEREVDKDEVVRGYEFERGRYVALEEKEITRVKPESAHVIHLTQFVDAGAIDRILIDQPYGPGFEDMAARVPCTDKIQRFTGWQPSWELSGILHHVIDAMLEDVMV